MLVHTVVNNKVVLGSFPVQEPPDELKNDVMNKWIYDEDVLSSFQNEDEELLSLKIVMAESKEASIGQISFTEEDEKKHKQFNDDLETDV